MLTKLLAVFVRPFAALILRRLGNGTRRSAKIAGRAWRSPRVRSAANGAVEKVLVALLVTVIAETAERAKPLVVNAVKAATEVAHSMSELRTGLAEMRVEFAGLRTEVAGLRAQMPIISQAVLGVVENDRRQDTRARRFDVRLGNLETQCRLRR